MYTPSFTVLRILATPQANSYIPDIGVMFITFVTHAQFYISDIRELFTLLGGHCLYNSCLLINFPILGAKLMTASCKHDLIFELPSASRNHEPERKMQPVGFIFLLKLCLATLKSLYNIDCIGS